MKKLLVLIAGLTALGVSRSDAAAQAQTRGFTIAPVVGWYVPIQDLRQVPEGESSVSVRRESSPLVGVALEAKFASTPISVRGQVAYAGGDLVAARLVGEEPCGSNCIRNVYRNDRLASTSALLVIGDAVLRSSGGKLRPYVVAGGGVRRYGFSQAELEGGFADAFSEDVSRFVVHLGAGLDASFRGLAVTAEFGDYFGRIPKSGTSFEPVQGIQHDLTGSLGIRFVIPW